MTAADGNDWVEPENPFDESVEMVEVGSVEGVETAPAEPSPARRRGRPGRNPATPAERKKKARERKTKPKTQVNGYKYDWFEIKTAFVEGLKDPQNPEERIFLNLKELSERLGVPLPRVRERSADERWFDQREQYQLRLAKTRQTKRILELSKESVDFDSSSLKVAKLGMAMITARMSEIAQDVQAQQRKREEALRLQSQGFLVDPRDLDTVIDARELDTLSRAAIQWQQLGQKALGTDVQKIDINQHTQIELDVDVEVTSISAELGRDDPERLAGFLQAAKRAGLLDTVLADPNTDENQLAIESAPEDEDEIVEAEIVETFE